MVGIKATTLAMMVVLLLTAEMVVVVVMSISSDSLNSKIKSLEHLRVERVNYFECLTCYIIIIIIASSNAGNIVV